MTRTAQRRIAVLLASSAAAFGVWKWVPGTPADRVVFETVASGFANPPLFISGSGKPAEPWRLKSFASNFRTDKRQAPVIVSLADEAGEYFQSSPLSPIDFAVIFRNFHRLGTRKLASAAVLAWDEPDPIGLAALEITLGQFDSLALASPLSFGPVASPLPASFRRASFELAAVRGDFSKLPQVNGLQIPNAILGGDSAVAGFSSLPLAGASELPPLLARWDDRVVISFPLLTVLQRLNIPPDKLDVKLGEFLRLGPAGPILPIDEYGRLTLPLRSAAPLAVIPADALIDGGDDLFPKTAPEPLVLRDDQSGAGTSTQEFSAGLSAQVAAMASEDNLASVRVFPRLPERSEMWTLGGAVVLLTLVAGLANFPRRFVLAVIAGVVIGAQWIGIGLAGVWLPGIALFAGVAGAAFAGMIFPDRRQAMRGPETLSAAESVLPLEPGFQPNASQARSPRRPKKPKP